MTNQTIIDAMAPTLQKHIKHLIDEEEITHWASRVDGTEVLVRKDCPKPFCCYSFSTDGERWYSCDTTGILSTARHGVAVTTGKHRELGEMYRFLPAHLI